MKQLEEEYQSLMNQFVRVSHYILPRWAINNHHFIFMNYLALESPSCRLNIHNWIDLIFGIKQHSAENYNMFKALTCEEYVKERESSLNHKLDSSEVTQIAEFGHNPMKIFDSHHEGFDYRVYSDARIVFDDITKSRMKNSLVAAYGVKMKDAASERSADPLQRVFIICDSGKDKDIIVMINCAGEVNYKKYIYFSLIIIILGFFILLWTARQ